MSINSTQLKNEMATAQYGGAHSLRLRSGDITINELRGYDEMKWSVKYFVDQLSQVLVPARLINEHKNVFSLLAAGLYILETLYCLRITKKDALPARFFIETVSPEIWALSRFASLCLVKCLRYRNAELKYKHPAW